MDLLKENPSVLLVDDEDDIREVLEISLADMGFKVYSAKDGKEAIKLFSDHDPLVVITDIKMPGMDGIELLRELKNENPDIEVIMITGHGDMDLAVRSLKYEATDFITKPINIDTLEVSLKRVHDKILMKNELRKYTENLEALVREKTMLQDHLSSLGLMIGSISHGIKGLLTGLDGGLYILNSGVRKGDDHKVKEGLDAIKLTSGRIRKMVLDILFYTKERQLIIQSENILGFANDVVDVVEPKMQGRQIQFIRDFDEAPSAFNIDADFLRSALINILDNAVDACLEDELKESHRINFTIKHDKENIIINIFDNGTGMDQETKENLFKLFCSSKGGKGTGFGLFI
ncbi:MAG: response regulator, partial [Deltaproteobacteria bacterium]|nr:response regulator [Deltaproteobacteria bacterium]